MLIVTLLITCCAADASAPLANAVELHVAGPWTVEVAQGVLRGCDSTLEIPGPVRLDIEPPETVRVRDEVHLKLPVFNEKAASWAKGVKVDALITEECSATDKLYPDSLVVKEGPGDSTPFQRGFDYELDPMWGTFGRIEGGAIGASQTVFVDYDYSPDRLDTIVIDEQGSVSLVRGTSEIGDMLPPAVAPDQIPLANVWVLGQLRELTEEHLFPIDFSAPDLGGAAPVAEELLPKTLAKLRAGDEVTIVAWGDSVTSGGGVNGVKEDWYQNQFLTLLQARFPKARIRMLNAGWGGASSAQYMKEPPGGTYDYVRDVLDPKPDLVTIEFVNDAYYNEEQTVEHYGKIVEQLEANGSEVVLITPHLVRPDWLQSDTFKVKEDPRPYVKGLRRFAQENGVALADASEDWCNLWQHGIPYTTLLANSINHPEVRGHAIFANRLVGLFPDK